MHISELDTPALLVDLDIMERNLERVADYAKTHGLRLRPHTKTHKSPLLARRQLALGASGLTVAKTSEAEVMVEAMAEAPDRELLVAYPVAGPAKLRRLIRIAQRIPVTVALDSEAAARAISAAAAAADVEIGVLAEIDAGLGRVGVSPAEEALDLARAIRALPGLRFRGLTFYPGHIRRADDESGVAGLNTLIAKLCARFERAGIPAEIVSGGSTPALFRSHEISGLTEIRPGTYIFNDLNTVGGGGCTLEDCAASILVTVVSTARPGQFIIDGGSKTFSSDRLNLSEEITFGRIMEAPGCRFHKMNEEHGFVDTSRAERTFAVGDQVRVIPNHVCVAVNLHERVWGIRGQEVELGWVVEGRGKLQ